MKKQTAKILGCIQLCSVKITTVAWIVVLANICVFSQPNGSAKTVAGSQVMNILKFFTTNFNRMI